MQHDVQIAAALQAGANGVAFEMHRHRHANVLARDQTLKIHVHRGIRHRMELHAANQRADRRRACRDLVLAGLPATAMQLADDDTGIERDQRGFRVTAINNRWYLTSPPSSPRRPLTGSRT